MTSALKPKKIKRNEENKDALLTFVKETLGDKVAEVTASKKLVSHPVCLTAKGGISFEMEKYFNSVQPDANMKLSVCLSLTFHTLPLRRWKNLSRAMLTEQKSMPKFSTVRRF